MDDPTPKDQALYEAVAAIYFADSSDYITALWSVVRHLEPEMAEKLQKNEAKAYDEMHKRVYGESP